MKILGIALLIIGLLTLAYGVLAERRDRSVHRLNPIEYGVNEESSMPVQSVVGMMALIGGTSLVITGNRRPWRR
ncbi:MAG: hypothetical protein R6X35_11065 [Candidatus Krumholzibacteriia bacterium]